MVYGQQAANSCGIASVMMVNFKMKKWRLAAALTTAPAGMAAIPNIGFNIASAIKLESQVYKAYSAVTGKAYDGSAYTDGFMLVEVLDKLGIGSWACEYYEGGALPGKIVAFAGNTADPTPAILHVTWRSHGAHFIVCDTVVHEGGKTYADFCDPGDASVQTLEIASGNPIVYQPEGSAIGDMKGWIIHRKGP